MRYLLMMSALLCLSGCGQNGGTVDDGGSMSNDPQVIIETGYLRCAPAADECDGALTCATEADETVCVEAEAEECVGEASCACEGAWVCGDRACADVDGGFECGTPPSADDVCNPADCGEPISGGLCEDGQPYEITCERNDGGSCEWVVGECQEPLPECQVEDCGEQISGGLCESGQPYEITCERNDGGSCEWVVGECQEPTADRQLTVNACPPVEGANDPYEMRSVELQGDILYVGVEYGGGCEEHGFLACPSDFRGPNPLQMTLGLSHNSNGDACEALMSELIAIDLTWIKEQHQAQFSGAEREVNVTIQGHNGGESFLYSY